jgi:hypothetical protein
MIAFDGKEKIPSKNKDDKFNQINLKGSKRENFSVAELVAPDHKKDNSLLNLTDFTKKMNEH